MWGFSTPRHDFHTHGHEYGQFYGHGHRHSYGHGYSHCHGHSYGHSYSGQHTDYYRESPVLSPLMSSTWTISISQTASRRCHTPRHLTGAPLLTLYASGRGLTKTPRPCLVSLDTAGICQLHRPSLHQPSQGLPLVMPPIARTRTTVRPPRKTAPILSQLPLLEPRTRRRKERRR